MQEGLGPGRIGLVATDDAESLGRGQRARLVQARYAKRDVMDAGSAAGEEAMQEAIVPARLQDLQAGASRKAPLRPGVGARRPPLARGRAAEDSFQDGRRVGHAVRGDRDVVELDDAHR
jgi:hypothetical protein